jgi:hypothetical protein
MNKRDYLTLHLYTNSSEGKWNTIDSIPNTYYIFTDSNDLWIV